MEGRSPGQADDELRRAPEHVVDMLAAVMRPPARPTTGPAPGTVSYARLARAEARVYADRIWAEAFQAAEEATRTRLVDAVRAYGLTPDRIRQMQEGTG